MFDEKHYVPVLKWKKGERNALKHLHRKQDITPLLEIQSPDKNKTIEDHLSGFQQSIEESWSKEDPIFVDVDSLYSSVENDTFIDGDVHPLKYIVSSVEMAGTHCIPVYSFYRYNTEEQYDIVLKELIDQYKRGLCIRLTPDDLSDLQTLSSDITDELEYFGLTEENVDIILDFKDISTRSVDQVVDELIQILLNFPKLNSWRTITFCGTSFPVQLSKKVPTKNNGSIPRVEWLTYQRLLKLNLARIPSFGDYTITNPMTSTDFDQRIMDMAPAIKYTTKSEFLIYRGSGVKASGEGFGQTKALAQDVISNPAYMGAAFSYGDNFIYERATNPESSRGNPTSWVTVNVNHHLEYVASQLSSSLVVSI
ncbi:beta family protein [Bacillus subtilis]|uniref:beta family protein n=1 Tax=Bacillus subtilis TaxID=1423 RepID=UPI000D0E07D0|nr:beta family protein [Bacillus subtilis]PSM01097.1 hypothetical protein C7T97_04365 [Bacillus subtilis]